MRNPGTASRDRAPQYAPPAASNVTATALPPTIGGKALLAGASAGDPSACYEIAVRFAQGRNTTPDLAKAAVWLERAARGGLVPAQFRLAVMYEKGLGVKKDVMEARRLYVAAAAKGHAKAMYNLAVLYAGGVDGNPDYALASQWLRKAAAHGVVDSQYNLAILYARGLGVERDFAESYKWFALAAKSGDKDAAHKRDEVALRLDPKQLESAKLNIESFVAVPQPDEATAINVPAGGWDQAVTTATTKSKAFVSPERFTGK
jgi:localization factor PodJL